MLTIGDGLVSQIPALVISIAAGFLVSKAGVEGSADKALAAQLATNPVALGMVAAASGVLGLVPGMPLIPFAALALGAGFLAWRSARKPVAPVTPTPWTRTPRRTGKRPRSPSPRPWAIDDVKIELGYGLLHLINDLGGPAGSPTRSRRCAGRSPPSSASSCRPCAFWTTCACPTRAMRCASRRWRPVRARFAWAR
jgi:flagellar biosynthesis protein FlhA